MKALVVLYAGALTSESFLPLFNNSCAFNLCCQRVSNLPYAETCLLLTSDEQLNGCKNKTNQRIHEALVAHPLTIAHKVISRKSWNILEFFQTIASESEGYDSVYITQADLPFLDIAFTSTLVEKHIKYRSEYTFADGYPLGFAPDILARGIIPVLAHLCHDEFGPVTRTSVFDTIKKDINSFDIETDIAPKDLRHLRLVLACDTHRNSLVCESLQGITAENYVTTIEDSLSSLFTLPSYYSIQISSRCPFECIHCPYPAFCLSGKAHSDGIRATDQNRFMSLEDFTIIINKIASYSHDAVISLSLFGECSYHPQILSFIEVVLSFPSLSLVIETTGIGWNPTVLEGIFEIVQNCEHRSHRDKAIEWIISMDAVGTQCYSAIHNCPGSADSLIREAGACIENLAKLFVDAVHPQMIRMNENEIELESFYRYWKEKLGRVIIQKHDHFCKTIEDRRVADLSPLVRTPCWHIQRDISIFLDGSVPQCREDLYCITRCGNILTDSLEDIRVAMKKVYSEHLAGTYVGLCGACDEYYTFNF